MNDRMLMLLEAISATRAAAGPLELARHTGLPQATTYRLLGELERLKLAERVGQGYRIGSRLCRLVLGGIPEDRLRSALGPELRALADETGETSFAARLTGNGVELFLRQLPNDGAAGGVLPPVGLRPAICSAAKAILAYLPVAERDEMIAKMKLRFPDHSDTGGDEYTHEMASIAESSFATCFGKEDPDTGSFATSLNVNGRSGYFSVGVVGPRSRIEANWLSKQPILKTKAALMSRRLDDLPLLQSA
ncbi:IclR family transcriptional regulator [Paracoccus sp. SY]|uniref:IclR family transcriptional regulator n=1 Tax=Paracoccus sp. SY TaxID=1330255 RepID=UPI000CD1BF56|nr:helix-turn-helix domain-containing protein [Paracoccus sp. SY]